MQTHRVFVPPLAADAMFEAIDAGLKLIVCITEGVPVHDMMRVIARARIRGARLIGPNGPGIVIPGVAKLGIIPNDIVLPGRVGVVSRSGTLTYEVLVALTNAGIGQSLVVGTGGDPLSGTSIVEVLEASRQTPIPIRLRLSGKSVAAPRRSRRVYRGPMTKQSLRSSQDAVRRAISGSARWRNCPYEAETASSKIAALRDAGVRIAEVRMHFPIYSANGQPQMQAAIPPDHRPA